MREGKGGPLLRLNDNEGMLRNKREGLADMISCSCHERSNSMSNKAMGLFLSLKVEVGSYFAAHFSSSQCQLCLTSSFLCLFRLVLYCLVFVVSSFALWKRVEKRLQGHHLTAATSRCGSLTSEGVSMEQERPPEEEGPRASEES